MTQVQEPYLPLTANFGVKREAILKCYRVENAVRAAWALTLLSEYRLIQLSRYSINVARVELKPVVRNEQPLIRDEILRDLALQKLWIGFEKKILEADAKKVKDEKPAVDPNTEFGRIGEASYTIERAVISRLLGTEKEKDDLLALFDSLGYNMRVAADEQSKKEFEKMFKNIIRQYAPETEYGKYINKMRFTDLVKLADMFDKVFGRESKLFKIVEYSRTVSEFKIPNIDVNKEADEVLKMLAPLGAKVEYVLSTLILNGYRKGITEGVEGLGSEERAYLEELLDTPFRRVALIIAYSRVGDIKRILQKLQREAFHHTTAVPKAYIESEVDLRRVIG